MIETEIKVRYDSLKSAQEEVARLTAELRRMMEGGDASVETMQDLQDRLNEARKSVSENADELSRWADITASDLSEAIDKAEFAVKQLNDSVAANKEIIAGLQEEYDTAKKGVEELTAQVDEFDKAEIELEEWKQLKELAEGDSEATAEAAEKIGELTAKIAELAPKMDGVNERIKQKTDRMAEAQAALEKEKANLAENTRAHAQMQMTLDQTKKKYDDMIAKATANTEKLKESTASFQATAMKLFSAAGLGAGIGAFIGKMQAVRAQMQDMENAMSTMMGADKAKGIMADLKQLATQSPLAMTDMVGAEKMMVSFGLDAKESVKYIKALSDISGGNSGKFNSLALAFSQMSASGKLMGQDLMQMINQGFNPLEEMSRKTGKSIKTLKDEMGKGAISSQMVQEAFMSATQAGGKFFGMSESGSKTINGQLSMLGDAWDNLYNSIGQKAEGVLGGVIGFTTDLVNNWQKLIPILIGVGAAYGVVKLAEIGAIEAEKELTAAKLKLTGVTITSTAAEGASTAGTLMSNAAKGIATKVQWAYNAALSACPYVAVALGIAALGYWIYDTFIKETELEKAQSEVNQAFADAEVQTKKDTATLLHHIHTIESATGALEEMNEAKDKNKDRSRDVDRETESVRNNSRAVEDNTGKSEDNSKALDKERQKTEQLNTAKGEIMSLASKYGITLSEEQLKVENLADTYKLLADEIERTNKAKALNNMKESAEKSIASAKSEMAQNMNERFQSVVYEDEDVMNDSQLKARMFDVQANGTIAMQNIMDRIEKGELKFTDKQLNDWGQFMAALGKKIGEDTEEYKSLKDYFGALRQNSWREQKFDTSFDYLADTIEILQAQAFKVQRANELAGEDARKKAEELRRQQEDAEKKEKQKEADEKAKKSAERRKSEELSLEKELYNVQKKEQDLYKEALLYEADKTESLYEQKAIQDEILEIERKQAIEELRRQQAEKIRKIKEDKTLLAGDKAALIKKTNELYEGTDNGNGVLTGGLIEATERDFSMRQGRADADFYKKRQDELKTMLESYGDYYDKRRAIEEKYAKERSRLSELGVSEDSAEWNNLERSNEKDLIDLGKSYNYDENEWKEAMKAEKYINDIAEKAVIDGTDAMLVAVSQAIAEMEGELTTLDEQIEQAKLSGDSAKAMELDARRLNMQKQINKSREVERSLQQDAEQHNGKASKELERQNKRYEKTKKVIGLVKTAFEELGDVVGEDTKKYMELVTVIADSTLSVINSIQGFTEAANKAMTESGKESAESVKAVEKASVILAVIGAVIQVATKIMQMFGKGNQTADEVSRLREMASIYSEIAGAQAEIASNARTAEQAKEATEAQTEALRKQTEATKEAIRARAANRSFNAHSTGYRVNEQLQGSDWQSAFSAAGVSVRNWEQLMNLAPEKLKEIRENNVYLWTGLDGDIRQSLESLISIDEQGKQAADDLQDRFANITLDNLKDSAVEAFRDMNAQASEFSDSIRESLADAISNQAIEDRFGKRLSEYKDKVAKLGEGGFTPEEAAQIMEEGKRIDEEINAYKSEIASQYGESGLFGSKDDNTTTTGTFAEMSEATANALEARFTAVYESNLRIEGAVTTNGGILGSLAEINSSIAEQIATGARAQAEAQTETQRILAESLLELRDIRANGTGILQIVRSMASDLAEVKNSTAKL